MIESNDYFLCGYLELFPTEIGFVTPVFVSVDGFFIELEKGGIVEGIHELSEEYKDSIIIYDKEADRPFSLNKGDRCYYGYKFKDKVIFGSTDIIVPNLKFFFFFETDWDYAKEQASQFIKVFDYPSENAQKSEIEMFYKAAKNVLSDRQLHVVRLLSGHYEVREIAERLNLPRMAVLQMKLDLLHRIHQLWEGTDYVMEGKTTMGPTDLSSIIEGFEDY